MFKTNAGPLVAGSRINGLQALPEEKALMHLLKRCMPGVSFADYHYFQNKSLNEVVYELLNGPYESTFPLKDYSSVNENTPDFKVPVGETWVNDIHYDHAVNQKRKQSLKEWLIQTLYTQHRSARSRLILLWHRYFPLHMDRLTLANKAYDYFATISDHALENFRELVLYQVTSFALLEYHKKIRPASTPLHKFHATTILDQYLFGEESSNFISKDRIKRFTRLLNEWNAINDSLSVNGGPSSSHIMEKPVVREYMEELRQFNNRLMQHEKIAQTLAERLFRWFVHAEPEKGSRIIRKMMDTALNEQYDIRKIVSSMLLHEQFYDPRYYGGLVKTPLEFTFGLWRELDIAYLHKPLVNQYHPQWELMVEHVESLGQTIGSPVPDKKWLTPEQLKQRGELIAQVTPPTSMNALRIIDQIDDAEDLHMISAFLINFYSSTHFSAEKKKSLAEFIETNLNISEEEWRNLLNRARNRPQDEQAVAGLRDFVRVLMLYFLDSPEYHFF